MTNTTPFEKPEFKILDRETAISNMILQEDIFERPEAYRTALTIGSVLMNTEAKIEDNVVDGDVLKKLQNFFGYRHDRDIDFDDASETALASDEAHRKLISMSRINTNQRNQSTKRGTNTGFEVNVEAEAIRDTIRQNRLAFFVGRVITYKSQQKSKDADPQEDHLRHVS